MISIKNLQNSTSHICMNLLYKKIFATDFDSIIYNLVINSTKLLSKEICGKDKSAFRILVVLCNIGLVF